MEYYKKVLMPIKVSTGNYCWYNEKGILCDHFTDREKGPNCLLGFYPLNKVGKGKVLKPKECKTLKQPG